MGTPPIAFLVIDIRFKDCLEIKKLIELWSLYLIDDGILALYNVTPSFHGILSDKATFGTPILQAVVKNEMLKSNNFKNCGTFGTIFYARKCFKNNLIDKFKNRIVLLKILLLCQVYSVYLRLTQLPSPIRKFFKKIVKPLIVR